MATTPVLRMTGISKTFTAVRALSEVDFELYPGEIHALLGENGAGKSTLIKVLTGVYERDAGTVELAGAPVTIGGPPDAQRLGISTVYQEVNLCPNLTVAENIFLGREHTRAGAIGWRRTRQAAAGLVARFGLDIDVTTLLGGYPLAVQQLVAIVRAVGATGGVRVLILDEPTSSLDRDEVVALFGVMRRLRDEGVAIVFVSHFLDQIYEVCDRITVLRNGVRVGVHPVADLDKVALVRLMLGRELRGLEALAGTDRPQPGAEVLRADGLGRRGGIAPFDLAVRAHEVVGLAGLLGSGRTELARLLFGADQADAGAVAVGGERAVLHAPPDAIRRAEGLVPDLTVRENIILAMQAARGWTRPLPRERVDRLVEKYVAALDIRPADPETKAAELSGGNQQKILLARWLITEPVLLILDEPTRGIDVGAKTEIQRLIASLAADGLAVLFISAELEEVLRLSDTVGVLRDRTLVARLDNHADLTEDDIMRTIASGTAT